MHQTSVKAIVEVEKGSLNRAVLDENFNVLRYREVSAAYPFAYGFILNTSSEDGDGIDCYILTDNQRNVGEIIECVPVGLLEVFENEEVDCKIVCIIEEDDFRFEQEHMEQIKRFILQIFKKHPYVNIQFGEYKDENYAVRYINDRLTR